MEGSKRSMLVLFFVAAVFLLQVPPALSSDVHRIIQASGWPAKELPSSIFRFKQGMVNGALIMGIQGGIRVSAPE